MSVSNLEFGEFRLDAERFELTREGRAVRLERKPLELLLLLADQRGRLVTRAEIAERLWDREVYVDTEHGINTAVRKIRQVLRDDPEEPRFLQTVTGKGYRFIGEVRAAVSVEVPAEEIAAPVRVVEEAAGTVESGWWVRRRLLVAGVLAGVVGTGAAGFAMRGSRVAGGAGIKTLAVLPLENFSHDPSQDYVADGMTEELITQLAKNSTLQVVSRTSVMAYKGVHRPLKEIARELGADGILEGSVERTGDGVHLNLQLIEAPADTHVWAESYDRTMSEAVGLPRQAARTIAAKLKRGVVAPAERVINPEAHDAYLRGRELWFGGSNERAGEVFRQAVAIQPDYALGWVGLSVYYGAGALGGELDPAKSLAPDRQAAQKAVELDNMLPEAHLALGAAYFASDWNWDLAMRELDRAVELDPRLAEGWHFRSKVFLAQNRYAEAVATQRKAMELEPFERPWGLAYVLLATRDYDAALAEARGRDEGNQNIAYLKKAFYEIYRAQRRDAEAADALAKFYALGGKMSDAAKIQPLFLRGGLRAVDEWRLAEARKRSASSYVSPVEFAQMYAQLGRREEALAGLEAGVRECSPLLLTIQSEPAFDSLHGEERYRAVIRQVGLSPAY